MDLPDYNQNAQFYSCCYGLLQAKHLGVNSLNKGIPETVPLLFQGLYCSIFKFLEFCVVFQAYSQQFFLIPYLKVTSKFHIPRT